MFEIDFNSFSTRTGIQLTLLSRYISKKNIRYYIYRKTNDNEFIGQYPDRDPHEKTAFFFAIPKLVQEYEEIPKTVFAYTIQGRAYAKNVWQGINELKYMEGFGLFHFKKYLDSIDNPKSETYELQVKNSDITKILHKPKMYGSAIIIPETSSDITIRDKNIRTRILKFLYLRKEVSRAEQPKFNLDEFLETIFCDEKELYSAGDDLLDEKLMEHSWKITFEGKRIVREEELGRIKKGGENTVFVAQSFDKEILPLYEDLFIKVIESCEYEPILMSLKEPDGGIDKEILSLIDSCKFMIADLTLERPSVYYEAGYAMGIGRKVFFTARDDHNTDHKDWKSGNPKVHFDVRNYKITWWELDFLEESFDELTKRIKAWENKR